MDGSLEAFALKHGTHQLDSTVQEKAFFLLLRLEINLLSTDGQVKQINFNGEMKSQLD